MFLSSIQNILFNILTVLLHKNRNEEIFHKGIACEIFSLHCMLLRKQSLLKYNTFGFNIEADVWFNVSELHQIQSLWKTNLLSQGHPLVLGGGSNILFTQKYPGLVLKNQIRGKKVVKEDKAYVWVEIGGGENWHQTVLWAVENGWGGIENLSLIPGSVGAAPIQNIGAYGVELESAFESLTAFGMFDGKMHTISHAECSFGYRDSIFKNEAKWQFFISSVTLKLSKIPLLHIGYGDIQKELEAANNDKPTISDVSKAVIKIRESKLPDPAVLGNCGSFFKNPVIPNSQFELIKKQYTDLKSYPAGDGFIKLPAAWLIENCGWKGYRKGDAGVHEKQALVLVNYGNATGKEIYNLALEIQASVNSKFGIHLEMEVNIL